MHVIHFTDLDPTSLGLNAMILIACSVCISEQKPVIIAWKWGRWQSNSIPYFAGKGSHSSENGLDAGHSFRNCEVRM